MRVSFDHGCLGFDLMMLVAEQGLGVTEVLRWIERQASKGDRALIIASTPFKRRRQVQFRRVYDAY